MKEALSKKELNYLAGSDTTSTKEIIKELSQLSSAEKRNLKKDVDELNDYLLMNYPTFYEKIIEPLKYGVQGGDIMFLENLMERF